MFAYLKKTTALILCLLAVIFVPLKKANAVPREPKNLTFYVGPAVLGVSDAALNSSPISSPINLDGYSALTVQVTLTRAAATTLVLACQQSIDGLIWDAFKKIDMTSGSGVGAQVDLSVSEPVAASTTVIFAPLTFCARFVKCAVTGANATSADKVTMSFFAGVL